MKTIKIAGALMIALLITARATAQDGTKEQLVVPLSDPGKTYKLNVGLIDGSITVNAYDGKDIIIDAHTNDEKKARTSERGTGMHRISAGNTLDVQAEEKNNVVSVRGSVGRVIDLTIKVPRGEAKYKISTVNNGNIEASNLNGELEVTNVNGYIQLTNVSGSVVANTINGKVQVTFKSIDPKAAMAFSTLNGNVDVTFPPGLKANVKLKSDRGDIYTDFDVVTDQRKPNVTRTAKGGMYNLKIDDWVYGKIDGGGPEMMMKNMNGNIYIRKAK